MCGVFCFLVFCLNQFKLGYLSLASPDDPNGTVETSAHMSKKNPCLRPLEIKKLLYPGTRYLFCSFNKYLLSLYEGCGEIFLIPQILSVNDALVVRDNQGEVFEDVSDK